MDGYGSRKKWGDPQGSKLSLKAMASVKPTQPRAQGGYDHYLAMLQERNRWVVLEMLLESVSCVIHFTDY